MPVKRDEACGGKSLGLILLLPNLKGKFDECDERLRLLLQ
jgi:hypothetical protein